MKSWLFRASRNPLPAPDRLKKMYTEQDFSGRMHPQEFSELRDAVVEAIAKGYQRELQNEEDEVDLGLAELNRKKDRAGK